MDTPAKIGRYEILERVGRGGMGVVYRGRDPVLDREVAIKAMLTDFEHDEAARPRFYREAKAAARLQHRNIVTVYEFGEEDGRPFIVMEFLRGLDLAQRIRQNPPLRLEEKLDIVAELCTGLHFAHQQGVIHRDVKPGNVWLVPDGSVKLLDFGISRVASTTLTQPGATTFGSAAYLAPEHVLDQPADTRADIFSVGVVLYEILTGERPFEGETPTAVLARIAQDEPRPIDALVPGLPPALVSAVGRALQKDPRCRYQHAGDLATELRTIRAALARPLHAVASMDLPLASPEARCSHPSQELGSDVPILSRPSPVDARPRSERAPLALATAAVVAVIALAIAYLWFAQPANRIADGRTSATAGRPPVAASKEPPVERPDAAPAPAVPAAVAAETAVRSGRSESREAASRQRPESVGRVSAGIVAIHGSYAFEVLDAGKVISLAAPSHEIPVRGRRTLRVRSAQYLLDQAVQVDPLDPRSRDVTIPEPGFLTLRWAAEDCSARIGDIDLGFPPVQERPIAAGTFLVRFTCPAGVEKQATVTVRPGQRKVESLRW